MKKLIKKILIGFTAFIFLVIVIILLFGRDNHKNLTGNMTEQLDQYLINKQFQGVVLLSKNDEVIFKQGYGFAAPNELNTPSTLFQIASLTKTFTAIGIMQLVEKGELSLDESISSFFPTYPHAENITVAHLLSHSSGIPDYLRPEFNLDYSKQWTPEQLVNITRNAELLFTPGSSFKYSNTGYVMLGMIIEQVSGQPYAKYIADNIFVPSGMHNSMFNVSEGMSIAAGHVKGKPGPHMDNTAAFATGDIISNVDDLNLFYKALHNNIIISEQSYQLMTTTYAKKFPYQYGYGWYTKNVMGLDAVGHSGGFPSGFRHYVAHLLNENVTVIVLSNEMSINSKLINRNLTSILLQKPIWFWEKLL